HDAEHRRIIMKEAAHPVAQYEDDAGTEERPEDRAGSADDRHQDGLDRNRKARGGRIDEAVVIDVEHAGDAREHAGERKRHVKMPADIVAEAAHARLARLDAAQRETE